MVLLLLLLLVLAPPSSFHSCNGETVRIDDSVLLCSLPSFSLLLLLLFQALLIKKPFSSFNSQASMAHSNLEADKMLDVYIRDYLLKKNLHASAKTFTTEGKVATEPVAIDAPGGFLLEWWYLFWDMFTARTNEAQQMKAKEVEQHAQIQQLQIIQQRHAHMHREGNSPSLNVPSYGMNRENVLAPSPASVLAAKMYEEQLKQKYPFARDRDSESKLLDASRLAFLRSTGHQPRQFVQSAPGNVSMALHQVHAPSQQPADNRSDILSRCISMDPSLYGLPGPMHPRSGLSDTGLNQGVISQPLKGWPLTVGIDRLHPSLGQQLPKGILKSQNQLQKLELLTLQQKQQLLAHAQAQAQAQGNIISSLTANRADTDPRQSWVLKNGLSARDGQPIGSDGSQHVDSPVQTALPLVREASKDRLNLPMKMMTKLQQPAKHQQQHFQIHQQQPSQNTRKRKHPSQSGTANSTGTANTANPSPNSPPSVHTSGDGMSIASTLPDNSSVSKNLMTYGSDGGTGGLASTSDHLDDLENFGHVGSFEDNVESLLSQDDGDTRAVLLSTVKRSYADYKADIPEGFSFTEVACLCSSNSKVVCCHFSSDGKLLASAGHDEKVDLWNMETLDCKSISSEHSLLVTDVRFRPNSTQLATSSFDKTVRVWNAADPSHSLFKLVGHTAHVMSLDFHPRKEDLLCSCDGNSEIRLWNVNEHACTRISKGANAQVRFQPQGGQFFAAAEENFISIIDVETDQQYLSLKGHNKEIHSICWDSSGEYLASVSEDTVRVWSVASGGECIHELMSSNGNEFHSCVFHPSYSRLLVIGGYQLLELWNPTEQKSMAVPAHGELVVSLANSPAAGMVASASHDKCVKLWK